MKNKTTKINLTVWMFLKTVPAALLFAYYWMCTVEGYHPVFRYIHAVTIVFAGILVFSQIAYQKKQQLFDEFARENLKVTDSFCLKIAYTLMVIAALACVFADFSGIVAGYFVVGGILLLSFVRAAVFALIDRKGL